MRGGLDNAQNYSGRSHSWWAISTDVSILRKSPKFVANSAMRIEVSINNQQNSRFT